MNEPQTQQYLSTGADDDSAALAEELTDYLAAVFRVDFFPEAKAVGRRGAPQYRPIPPKPPMSLVERTPVTVDEPWQ
jgi:hypothetical protein